MDAFSFHTKGNVKCNAWFGGLFQKKKQELVHLRNQETPHNQSFNFVHD